VNFISQVMHSCKMGHVRMSHQSRLRSSHGQGEQVDVESGF
jgi:hypothetical protein